MAKPKAKKATQKRGGAKGGKSGSNRLLVLLTLMAMVPFSLPTMLVLFCGLLPALVAAVGERGSSRYAWICVGGLNFSGLAPWLFDLWFGHHTLDYALHQVIDLRLYLTAYGAAAVGWVLYMATPPVVNVMMAATSQRRAILLAAQQRKLVELWGDDVMSQETPDADDILL